MYLTHTHPDISYAVGEISIYIQEPHDIHLKAAKHILRYVQGTMSYGIHYEVGCELDLIGSIDSYWVGDDIDRKSTSWYTLSLGLGPICWLSKKQSTIYLSFVEAEYRGVVNCVIQALWLHHFLTDLGIQFHYPTVIWCVQSKYTNILQRSSTVEANQTH
jgi:hypothetical protein